MSRSRIPLPRWVAPAACPLFHSLSSRISMNMKSSPAASFLFTSLTEISLIFLFAVETSLRNPGECFMDFPLLKCCVFQKYGMHSRYESQATLGAQERRDTILDPFLRPLRRLCGICVYVVLCSFNRRACSGFLLMTNTVSILATQ